MQQVFLSILDLDNFTRVLSLFPSSIYEVNYDTTIPVIEFVLTTSFLRAFLSSVSVNIQIKNVQVL